MSSLPTISPSFGLSSSPVYWRWRDPLDDAGIGAVLDATTSAKAAPKIGPGTPRASSALSPSSTTSPLQTSASQEPGSFDQRTALDRWIHGEREELLRCLQRSQAREHEAAIVHVSKNHYPTHRLTNRASYGRHCLDTHVLNARHTRGSCRSGFGLRSTAMLSSR